MRRTLPSTASLACFEATCRHRNVTRAAEELNMTQSAVSRRLMELERQLGKPLFRRIKNKLVPEAAAIQYGKDLGRILREIEAATTQVIAQGKETGLLTVAVPPTLASRWLIPKLNDFIVHHSQIDLNLVSKIRPFDFEAEGIDVAVHLGDGTWPDVHMQPLMSDFVVPVCAPDLIGNCNRSAAVALVDQLVRRAGHRNHPRGGRPKVRILLSRDTGRDQRHRHRADVGPRDPQRDRGRQPDRALRHPDQVRGRLFLRLSAPHDEQRQRPDLRVLAAKAIRQPPGRQPDAAPLGGRHRPRTT